jgi:hypothetical protein
MDDPIVPSHPAHNNNKVRYHHSIIPPTHWGDAAVDSNLPQQHVSVHPHTSSMRQHPHEKMLLQHSSVRSSGPRWVDPVAVPLQHNPILPVVHCLHFLRQIIPTPCSILPRLKAWTEILHTVIRHIMVQLQLPTTHLIVQNSSTNDESKGAKSTPTSQPLDILRAFRYEPIHVDTSGTHHTKLPLNGSQLGSSPHTDWGSWTGVWQDDTNPPCLQTYCHHCQKWNSIPSPPTPLSPTSMYDDEIDDNTQTNRCSNLSNEAYFIVHVGDLTSLSIRQAIHQLSLSRKSSNTIPIADIWPSPLPRHRVLLPINQYRHSLVYFVYPPNTTTPALITDSLLNWCRRNYFKHMDDDG